MGEKYSFIFHRQNGLILSLPPNAAAIRKQWREDLSRHNKKDLQMVPWQHMKKKTYCQDNENNNEIWTHDWEWPMPKVRNKH